MKLCASSKFSFVRLRDCGEIVTGSTPPKANPDFWGGEIPFVTPAQLGFQPPITTAHEYVTSKGADRGRLLPEGAVLLCCIGSLGKTGIAGVPLISNQQINAIIFDPIQVDARYGYHAARSLTPLLEHFAPSTTVKIVKKSAFAEFQIPLPPLAEQKRIAVILDAADALRAKRREALDQLDNLLQSTFLDMFGDPVTNPMGWEVTTVSRIGNVQGGLQVTSKRRSLPIERPYLRVANVFRGFLKLDEIKTIRLTESELLRTSLHYEDILIVEGHGNKAEIGRCARWDGSIDQCVHQNHLIRLRCDRSKASPIYVENFINSPGGRRSLVGTSRTTSGLNTISVSKVGGSEIQLPSLDRQYRFAAIVESIEHQKASQRAHLAELDTLFASLQSRAFRGDL